MCNFLTSVIVRAGLLLACGAAMVPAEADNGTLYVAPGPTTLISLDMTKRCQRRPETAQLWRLKIAHFD